MCVSDSIVYDANSHTERKEERKKERMKERKKARRKERRGKACYVRIPAQLVL